MDSTSKVALFDLPLEDLMVPYIARHFSIRDIFAFRSCSKTCKKLAESVLSSRAVVEVSSRGKSSCSEATFNVILQHCRRIRKLTLNSLEWITDEALTELFNNNPLLEIVSLDLDTRHRKLTSKALHPLAEKCKKLVSVTLEEMYVDNAFLEILGQHNQHLLEVDFTCAYGFSDEAVWKFLEKQPHLRYIALPEVGSYSEVATSIGGVCKDLRCLNVQNYWFGDELAFKKLVRKCRKLSAIFFSDCARLSGNIQTFFDKKNIAYHDAGDYECYDIKE